ADRVIILDAKYTANALVSSQYGPECLNPGHVNQMFAYAMNIPVDQEERHVGLVYPLAGTALRERYEMERLTFWAWTVDLAKPWQDVRTQLFGLIDEIENPK